MLSVAMMLSERPSHRHALVEVADYNRNWYLSSGCISRSHVLGFGPVLADLKAGQSIMAERLYNARHVLRVYVVLRFVVRRTAEQKLQFVGQRHLTTRPW